MPKVRNSKTGANSPQPPASEKPVTDVVSLEVLEKLAQSIESNQKMLARLWNLRKQQESQKQEPEVETSVEGQESKTELINAEPVPSPDLNAASKREDTHDSKGSKLSSRFEEKAAELAAKSEKARLSPICDLPTKSQKDEVSNKIDKPDSQPKDQAGIDSHHDHRVSHVELDDEDEYLDDECEIITTEVIRKLENVPKIARLVKDPAKIRKLLEEINLSHLPRKQTNFVVWYQTTIGGVFYKESVKSIHQTVKSVYFQLNSGTVLKFNRALPGET